PALLPGALLRDFSGYTLVVRPAHAAVDEFIGAYRALLDEIYAPRRRLAKIAADGTRFLKRGYPFPALVEALDQLGAQQGSWPWRTFVAGTDSAPSESVPLTDVDFASEAERDAILEPARVTDALGRILPCWLEPTRVYDTRGRPTA